MLLFGKYLLAAAAGIGLGLLLTVLTLQSGFRFGAVTAGPWTAFPRAGGPDPYARAALAHSGELPLGASEGLSFAADSDSAGRTLDPRCDYVVSGRVPQGRLWTLTVMSPDGRLVDNPSRREGFTSRELLRDEAGGFAIALSRRARTGDWLPLAENGAFILALRLYESEFSAAALSFEAISLPQIARGACL